MTLDLLREASPPSCTCGSLLIDGVYACFTMERSLTVPDHPAIPPGTYPVIVNFSQRFGRRLPLILNVPGRSGIRIHPGNDGAHDSEGCILLGLTRSDDKTEVWHSREACNQVQTQIQEALDGDEAVTLTIREAEPQKDAA